MLKAKISDWSYERPKGRQTTTYILRRCSGAVLWGCARGTRGGRYRRGTVRGRNPSVREGESKVKGRGGTAARQGSTGSTTGQTQRMDGKGANWLPVSSPRAHRCHRPCLCVHPPPHEPRHRPPGKVQGEHPSSQKRTEGAFWPPHSMWTRKQRVSESALAF